MGQIGGMRNTYQILIENLKRKSHSGDLNINGTTILKYTLKVLGLYNVNWIYLAHDEGSVSGSK